MEALLNLLQGVSEEGHGLVFSAPAPSFDLCCSCEPREEFFQGKGEGVSDLREVMLDAESGEVPIYVGPVVP